MTRTCWSATRTWCSGGWHFGRTPAPRPGDPSFSSSGRTIGMTGGTGSYCSAVSSRTAVSRTPCWTRAATCTSSPRCPRSWPLPEADALVGRVRGRLGHGRRRSRPAQPSGHVVPTRIGPSALVARQMIPGSNPWTPGDTVHVSATATVRRARIGSVESRGESQRKDARRAARGDTAGSGEMRRNPGHVIDALSCVLLKGWLRKPSWPHTMSRLGSRTPGFRFAGHQHRWMSSAAWGTVPLARKQRK